MRMKLLGIAILSVLAVASAARAEMMPIRTISVSGTAERKLVPDEGHIYINVGATDLKMAAAKTKHDAKLKKIFAITDKQGIDRKHLSTQSSSVQPHYEYSDNRQIFRGYRMQTSLDIKVSDINKTPALVEQLMSAGLKEQDQQNYGQFISTSYTLSNPDKIREEMAAEAIRKAREKADKLAAAAGTSVIGVYQINESEAPQFYPRPMMAMAMKAGGAGDASSESVAPPTGEQEVRSTVNIIFEIKN